MRDGFSAVRGEMHALHNEVKDGDEETRGYMRMLHEEVLARIAMTTKLTKATK